MCPCLLQGWHGELLWTSQRWLRRTFPRRNIYSHFRTHFVRGEIMRMYGALGWKQASWGTRNRMSSAVSEMEGAASGSKGECSSGRVMRVRTRFTEPSWTSMRGPDMSRAPSAIQLRKRSRISKLAGSCKDSGPVISVSMAIGISYRSAPAVSLSAIHSQLERNPVRWTRV